LFAGARQQFLVSARCPLNKIARVKKVRQAGLVDGIVEAENSLIVGDSGNMFHLNTNLASMEAPANLRLPPSRMGQAAASTGV
jgi:hypothetical protein